MDSLRESFEVDKIVDGLKFTFGGFYIVNRVDGTIILSINSYWKRIRDLFMTRRR